MTAQGPNPVCFGNKVQLEQSYAHLSTLLYGLFYSTTAELSSYDRDRLAW